MGHEERELGRTGVKVTRLGYGAMELAGFGGEAESPAAARVLGEVLDSGITLIDTAPDYAASEDLIGAHLAHRRDEYFLASKCGCVVGRQPEYKDGQLEHDFSRANVRAGVEQSLRRMKTDRIDLVQIHMSPPRAQIEEEGLIEELHALRDEGKLRFIGMSGTLPHIEDHLEMGVFDVFQIPYSALQPEHESILTRAAAKGAGTIVRGGVARGAPAPDYGEGKKFDFWKDFAREKRDVWEQAELDELLDGMSRMEFMLRFVLGHPDLDTTIVGTSNPVHLKANVEVAAKGPLPEGVREEARLRIARILESDSVG
jgi:aryl-alcohol dehydrogenase-like predicted oxidoreductase